MALGLMEKMGLQKQARTLQAEIMAGDLAIMVKLAKQKAWREVMLKLQADAVPVEPLPTPPADEEVTDEEATQAVSRSIVGFEVAGVKHTELARNYIKKYHVANADVVLSNEAAEMAILWEPKIGFKRDSLYIHWPKSDEKILIPAQNAWDGVKSYFPPKLRKQVRRFVERALAEVESLVSAGEIAGYRIAFPWVRGSMGYISVKKPDVAGGGSGRCLRVAVNTYIAKDKGIDGISELLQLGDDISAGIASELLLKFNQKEGEPYPVSPELAEQWNALVSDDSPAKKTFSDILEKAKAAALPAENPLFAQYIAGDFNDLAADKFRAKIVEVADAGLEFELVKQGVVSWIDANPSLIVEAA